MPSGYREVIEETLKAYGGFMLGIDGDRPPSEEDDYRFLRDARSDIERMKASKQRALRREEMLGKTFKAPASLQTRPRRPNEWRRGESPGDRDRR